MRLYVIAVGSRLPRWVDDGFAEYARRMPTQPGMELRAIAPAYRGKGSTTARALADEWTRVRRALPGNARRIALAIDGQPWSTEELARRLERWMAEGRDVALLIGGPEGLASEALTTAEHRWSLGPLTLPHGLTRIVVAEQLYRAWSVITGHPYHRGG